MAGDWIRLYRAMMDHAVFQDDWLCRLFVWCLFKANFQKSSWKGRELEAGQFITGRIRASEELGVAPSKWYRGMQKLASPPICVITLEVNSEWTTVTVCNYKTYQYANDESEQLPDSERTASEQQVNTVKEFNNSRTKEPSAIPESLQTQEFTRAWGEFRRYRKEKRCAITPTHEASLLRQFTKWGPDRSVAAIDHTILKGWQGLKEPDEPAAGSRRPSIYPTLRPGGDDD